MLTVVQVQDGYRFRMAQVLVKSVRDSLTVTTSGALLKQSVSPWDRLLNGRCSVLRVITRLPPPNYTQLKPNMTPFLDEHWVSYVPCFDWLIMKKLSLVPDLGAHESVL